MNAIWRAVAAWPTQEETLQKGDRVRSKPGMLSDSMDYEVVKVHPHGLILKNLNHNLLDWSPNLRDEIVKLYKTDETSEFEPKRGCPLREIRSFKLIFSKQ